MRTGNDSHRDIEALRDFVGEQVFARGQACYDGGNVSLISVEPERATAHVRGVRVYYTELLRQAGELTGKCGCAAGISRGGCEHLVAVALAVDASARDAPTQLSNVVSILARQGRTAPLAAGNLERTGSRRRAESSAAVRNVDDEVIEAQFRKAIDEATKAEEVFDRRNVEIWAKSVRAVFDSIRPLASTKRAPIALRLIDHAIGRIEEAAKVIFDPDNCCGDLFDRARTIHRNAASETLPGD